MAKTVILFLIALALMGNRGCQTLQSRLDDAKVTEAVQQVGTPLPGYPSYCSEIMPTVVPKVGELFRHTQARWEVVRANENKRIEWCASHYDEVRRAYSTGQ